MFIKLHFRWRPCPRELSISGAGREARLLFRATRHRPLAASQAPTHLCLRRLGWDGSAAKADHHKPREGC